MVNVINEGGGRYGGWGIYIGFYKGVGARGGGGTLYSYIYNTGKSKYIKYYVIILFVEQYKVHIRWLK